MLKSSHELVEDGVEDERAPADEEDGRDAAEQDVCPASSLVDLGVLAWRPEMITGNHIQEALDICNLLFAVLIFRRFIFVA